MSLRTTEIYSGNSLRIQPRSRFLSTRTIPNQPLNRLSVRLFSVKNKSVQLAANPVFDRCGGQKDSFKRRCSEQVCRGGHQFSLCFFRIISQFGCSKRLSYKVE